MSDPLERDGDPLFAAAAEYGRTHLGWKDELTVEPVGTVTFPETAAALTEIGKQLHIANMIAFQTLTGESYRAEIRRGLGLS